MLNPELLTILTTCELIKLSIPRTVNPGFTEDVIVNDPDIKADPVYGNTGGVLKAYDAVPNNDPVMPDVTVSEFNVASLPEVIIFFQLGILFYLMLWLDTHTNAVYMPTSLI